MRALKGPGNSAVSPRDSHEILSTIGGVHDLQIFLWGFLKEFLQDFGTVRNDDS